ncbi:MAG: NHLP family bacteriocin export ABC transporter permease/ATPase subunit, partial [Clostridia bacterium]|nr:NHLP family bacteriocin export ABC transporter permease/ATPase subunit [Clostridia bacterium]
MGWFEEQLKSRNQKDSEIFEEAVKGLGDAVMGRRFADAHDNASTAIGEILKYYHIHVHLEELPREVKTLEEQLDYRLRPYGIARRQVTLEKGFYKNAIGPMIGTLKEDGSTVALIPGKLSGYSFYDHKTGKHIRLTRKSEKLLETEALAFYLPLPERALTVADLLKYMVGQLTLADVLLYVGSLAGASLLGLLAPMFARLLFGSVLSGGDVGVLLALAAFMAAYGISRVLYQVYESLVASRVRIKQDLAVQAAVMMRVLSLPPEFFRDYASGELSERAAYVKSLCTMLFDSIGTTGLTAVFSLVYVGQLFRYAPGMVAPAVITSAVTLILSMLTTLAGIRVSRERMLLSSKESGMSYSMIAGIQKIKLAGAEKRMFSRWARLYARVASLAYNPPFLLKMHTALQTFVSLAGWFVIYLFACRGGVSV